MKRDILNLNFLSAVNEKIPNRTKLANYLVEVLQIEKEAVYRRLRGEVPFTFLEVSIIAGKLGISLDKIIGVDAAKLRPFGLSLWDFEIPNESDLILMKNYISFLEIIKRDPNCEVNEAWNIIPLPLSCGFSNLIKFYILKWRYFYKNDPISKKFDEIYLNPKVLDLQQRLFQEYREMQYTNLILDRSLFYNLIEDIKYFISIELISEENRQPLKKDILALLDYIDELSFNGEYRENGNKVNIYISGIEIDTNYSCVESRSNMLCLIRTLYFNAITTTDELTSIQIKGWLGAMKKLSTSISGEEEAYRKEYINTQKNIINSL